MRYKILACNVLGRDLPGLIKKHPEAEFHVKWFHMGWHEDSKDLRSRLQKEIDRTEEEGDYDAILLAYGLCASATAGLHAARTRLVIPRAHDCITLILGSRQRFVRTLMDLPNCFWYTANWIECTDMPGPEQEARMRQEFEDADYDEEDIEYLLEELGARSKYRSAAYISTPFSNQEKYRRITKEAADYYGWEFHEVEGDLNLLERLITGDWKSSDFLVLEPGEIIAQSHDPDDVIEKKRPEDD